MAGVFEDNNRGVRSDNFDLPPEEFSIRRGAADRQRRHGQPGLRELREIFGCLNEGNKIRPAGAHPSRTRIGWRVGCVIGFWQRMVFVGGELIPEMLEVNSLAPADQCLRSGAIESE